MRSPLFHALLLTAVASATAYSQSEMDHAYSDPVAPLEVETDDSAWMSVPFWHWNSLIQETENRIHTVEGALTSLPPPQLNRQIKAFGYHSDQLSVMDDLPDEPRWQVDFKRRYLAKDLYIALVPSVDHRIGGKQQGYGFPRRFTIDALERDGTTHTVVDWRTQDFPDPGRLPVLFKVVGTRAPVFRLNVYRGSVDQDLEYFALAEVIMVVGHEFATTEWVKPSSSYASPPYWDVSYFNDWRLGLGLPTFDHVPKGSDYVVQSEKLRDAEVRLRIDLGSECAVPWTSLFPARSPGDISVPGYGFPRTVKIMVSYELRDGSLHEPLRYYESTSPKDPGNDWIRIRGSLRKNIAPSSWAEHSARWVEFTFSDFPVYNGVPTFALGEISIDFKDVNHLFGRPVQLIEGPEECAEQLDLLVDNMVSGRELSDRVVWLRGLAARKPLESELLMLQDRLKFQQERYAQLVRTLLFLVVGLLLLAAIVIVAVVIRNRRIEGQRLRKQITRDLHDDLGSKMANISLTSEFIRSQTTNPDIVEGSDSIFSTAGEMTTSLRDVLWFTDTETDQLAELISRLGRVAEQVVDADQLSLSLPSIRSLPRKVVRLGTKREIIYFLREALNNAVKYSEAEQICVVITLTGKRLGMVIEDDGIGFALNSQNGTGQQPQRNYGLKAMEQRANKLGGIYQLKSELGKGTCIELEISL